MPVCAQTSPEKLQLCSAPSSHPCSKNQSFVCFLCIQQSAGRSFLFTLMRMCCEPQHFCILSVWGKMFPLKCSYHSGCVCVSMSHPVSHVWECKTQGSLSQTDWTGTGKHPPYRASHTRPSGPVITAQTWRFIFSPGRVCAFMFNCSLVQTSIYDLVVWLADWSLLLVRPRCGACRPHPDGHVWESKQRSILASRQTKGFWIMHTTETGAKTPSTTSALNG